MTEVDAPLYRERAHLVALLAAIFPASMGTDPAAPDWPVVYIGLPEGQVSWHISPDDMDLFGHVPAGPAARWDGHTTDEKYRRIRACTRNIARGAGGVTR